MIALRSVCGVRRLATGLARSIRAVGAIEFALTAPFLILLYVGGFQLMDAISAYRKVTLTTRTLADVTTQYTSVRASDVDAVLATAQQVMSPYSASDTVTRVSEIRVNNGKQPVLQWSRASSGPRLKQSDLKKSVAVPAELLVPNTYLVFAETSYTYTPTVGSTLLGPMQFKDQIYMNPRRSDDIPCDGC